MEELIWINKLNIISPGFFSSRIWLPTSPQCWVHFLVFKYQSGTSSPCRPLRSLNLQNLPETFHFRTLASTDSLQPPEPEPPPTLPLNLNLNESNLGQCGHSAELASHIMNMYHLGPYIANMVYCLVDGVWQQHAAATHTSHQSQLPTRTSFNSKKKSTACAHCSVWMGEKHLSVIGVTLLTHFTISISVPLQLAVSQTLGSPQSSEPEMTEMTLSEII